LQAGAVIVDPRPWAAPAIADVYARYPHIGPVLPAMGYTHAQLADLTATLVRADVEFVLSATPIDLAALLQVDKPVIRVRYEYADAGEPTLGDVLQRFLASRAA
jgi:predicted GTPase